MFVFFLTISLLLWLIAAWFSSEALFAVAVVSSVVSLTAVGGVSRWALAAFWMWVTGVLLYLVLAPAGSGGDLYLVAGIPVATFWMLLGIWLLPMILWPVVFAVTFRKWMKR